MPDEAQYWDHHAPTFDDEPDHGLRDPGVRAAWAELLLAALPPAPATIADLGCGTGSLAVLLAELGYTATGIDVSPAMLRIAQQKALAAGVVVDFLAGDAAEPPVPAGSFDVVLSRHVLWMFDDRDAVLSQWLDLLRPDGVLVLIEGLWFTGVGISATDCRQTVLRRRQRAEVTQLGPVEALWGGHVGDERYLLVSNS